MLSNLKRKKYFSLTNLASKNELNRSSPRLLGPLWTASVFLHWIYSLAEKLPLIINWNNLEMFLLVWNCFLYSSEAIRVSGTSFLSPTRREQQQQIETRPSKEKRGIEDHLDIYGNKALTGEKWIQESFVSSLTYQLLNWQRNI